MRGCRGSLLLRDLVEAESMDISAVTDIVVSRGQEGPGEAARAGGEEAGRHRGVAFRVYHYQGHVTVLQGTDGVSTHTGGVGQVLGQTSFQSLVLLVLEFLVSEVLAHGEGGRGGGRLLALAAEQWLQHLDTREHRG